MDAEKEMEKEIDQSTKLTKGFLMTIEGGEGAGKSTQINEIKQQLEKQGYNVCVFREPGGSPFSEDIRDVFFKHEGLSVKTAVHLMNAQREDNIEKIIKPHIEKGWIVIADRFTGSTYVYQGLLNNKIEHVKEHLVDFPQVSVFFDCPPEIGLNRIKQNKRETNHFDNMALKKHQDIYNHFKSLPEIVPEKLFWTKTIDASQTIQDVQKSVIRFAKTLGDILDHKSSTSNELVETKDLTEHIYRSFSKLDKK